MSRPRLSPLTLTGLADLPITCQGCVLGHPIQPAIDETGQPATWARSAHADWGFCGIVAHQSDRVMGFLLLSAPLHVPRIGPQSGVALNPDAVVVMNLRVLPEYAGVGIGRQLVQSAAGRLTRTHFQALEALATTTNPSCAIPSVSFLESVGFTRLDDHLMNPRMRLEFSRTVRWVPDLRPAWDRLVGWARPLPPEPAGRAPMERHSCPGS